ncbi:Putative homeodomain-like transcription factor superfamily protein [Zea mays]|uniref:Putative homeodomain-like transcription factor superfamily protein n=3 Tax=Zea mays TaxID=4577 RepID=A0A1D6FK45_MAIZE|nr:Putative homeodomain-like transcription factor superfamily protein [Zea mays]
MWFCHRRLKDRKPPAKRQLRDEEVSVPVIGPPPPVLPPPLPPSEMMVGTVGTYGEQLLPYSRRGSGRLSAAPRLSVPEIGRRYYEPPQVMLPHMAPVHLMQAEHRVIDSVEALIGEPLRDDGPVLGIEFDPLPPGAFGAPIVPEQPRQPFRSYETKMFSGPKTMKASAILPTTDPLLQNTGKRKSFIGSSHLGSQAVHEYQFLPEQPSDTYERASQSHFYDSSAEASNLRVAPLSTGSRFLHGVEQAPSYTFHSQSSGSSHLTQRGSGRSPIASALTDHEGALSNINASTTPIHGQLGIPQVAGFESPLASPERLGYHDEDTYHMDRKRKHNEEAKIAREVEAHEKRIRKELEKQDLLNRKREEQMRREMERHDRERRKEEERLMRERQREEEKFQREQRREHKRMEKFMQKQSIRAEKLRQREELRREKEAARQKAANERATARRIARESMELMEDERLELLELASRSKGLPSMVSLDSDTLQQLDSFRGMLGKFPPETVRLKVPFSIKPWAASEDIIGNLLMAWKFFVTFGDVLGLPSFTLDEFVQALHDYDSRLLGELHVSLLKSVIKDIEDVARTPSVALGVNQSSSANPGGGHPQIVEGAYAWGINILNWQRHLNFLTWPEILRQFGLCAGFGPQLKKSDAEIVHHRDDNEGRNGVDVISILRNGSAAVKAAALMKERGYTNRRRSRHRLTPGTVKFAAFHVLSLEGSKGLTILEVAEKIQKSGLRDLTTSKTPEASISAALSRDTKLFERTAPSTYCVKTPYRKDPDDSEAVLAAAREKIRAFQNALPECEEVEKDVDEAERDDDSECDDADDDADGDDVNIEDKDAKSPLVGAQYGAQITVVGDIKKESNIVMNTSVPPSIQIKSSASVPFHTLDSKASSSTDPEVGDDAKDIEIDESNQGESWVQGLAEGDYCDLSVDERLNALVALIAVANEGNSIRAILEERLEAASALKKQLWAEAQLDKRRIRDDFTSKMQYDSYVSMKVDTDQENNAAEITLTPVHDPIKNNNGNANLMNNGLLVDKQNQLTTGDVYHQRNGASRESSTNAESLSVQQYASSEKTRSQLKSFIGHKAEQLYVYRSLPLGQDRRRNRYWQFSASSSSYDPGSGRIFFESRDGYWRVIDTSEAFEALVASLDTRGIRESHLHSILQSIEPTFKEAVERKRCANLEHPTGRTSENGSNESPNCNNEFGSPCSTLSGVASDNLMAHSDIFKIEVGRNEAEKNSISKRASVFLKWIWRECYSHQSTYAMRYGKKRCPELIHSCDYCYQIYLAEERHCSCHKTFKHIHNFLEHSSQCEEKQRTDPNWKMQTVDLSVPVGLRLLRLLLATIEALVPAEALLPFWTDGYRKSWGAKLYSASSAEEVLQMLSVLESAIKRDYLSSNFETTTELLNSSTQDFATQNSAGGSGSATALPWVPDTTAAVALRLLDLDASISYTLHPKLGSNKEQESGDFMKLPPRYPSMNKGKQEIEQFRPIGFDQQDGTLLPNSNGRRGRGRGGRGGSRGGRSRGHGGRVPRGIGSSSRIQFRDDNSMLYGRAPRKNARGGRGRGRGRGRGLRTVRPRQPSELSARSIPKANLLGSFSMLSKTNHTGTTHSPESSGAEEWAFERREYVKDDENNLVSQSDESEENVEPMNEEYGEHISGYPRDNSDSRPVQMMGDGSDDNDEDAEGDEGEEDGEDYEAEDPGDEDDDVEMDGDDDVETTTVEMEQPTEMRMEVVHHHILQSIVNDE